MKKILNIIMAANLLLCCEIKIVNAKAGKVTTLTSVQKVEIERGFQSIVNTATITFPKNIKFNSKNEVKLSEVITPENKITIKLGYDNELVTEFEGYVTKVHQTIPIQIDCENEGYNLKRQILKPKVFEKATLKDVAEYCVKGMGYSLQVLNSDLGKFTIEGSNNTAASVFNYLKQQYGYSVFFIDSKKLIVGLPYDFEANKKSFVLDFQKNVVNNNLVFKSKDDYKLKLIGISHQEGKKPLKVTYNPEGIAEGDGETRTIHCNSNLSESQIKKQCEEQYQRVVFDGYNGDMTLYGIPYIQPLDAVKLKDKEYLDREGKYLVNRTFVRFGSGIGYRRTLYLGKRI